MELFEWVHCPVCRNKDRDYKGTASLYDVSYSQVYS